MAKKNSLSAFSIAGIEELSDLFSKFQFSEANKIVKKIVREELKPVAQQIKADFPKDTGITAKEIKVRNGIRRRGWINIDVSSKDDNYIAKFIEYGTFDAKTGKQLIKPQLIYKTVFNEQGPKIRKRIIAKIEKETASYLNKGKLK